MARTLGNPTGLCYKGFLPCDFGHACHTCFGKFCGCMMQQRQGNVIARMAQRFGTQQAHVLSA
jgi:hypothetical protein